MIKYFKLDKEEQNILEEIEKGDFVSVSNLAEKKEDTVQAAENTLNKTKNINLRLSEKDVSKLKAKAVKLGIPYQTYAASILHQTAND